MSTRVTKQKLREMKKQLKAANNERDALLLKLFVLLIFVAAIAAVMYGKVHIPVPSFNF